jgi:DNA-directed RNA polymerase specialized sigma24 family protein
VPRDIATAVATLSAADKMLLYQYYYSELNDVEIGNRTGQTSQGVNKRRRRVLALIKEVYEKV